MALVGQTGAGKSTAMNLLQRLWDPVGAAILIDGQDLRDVSLESLRRSIGVVFQESMLFNRSIRENLRIGRPARPTDDELEHACRLADAHEFIMRQPQGYDTAGGRAGLDAIGRAAAAAGDRAGAAEGPADPDPGRGDERAGCGDGGAGVAWRCRR